MRISNKFLGVSLIVAALVLVNGYLLFKNNNVILKSYFANDVQFTTIDTHQEELEKKAAVVPSMQHFIATPVDQISEVMVNKGQDILSLEALAFYKEEDALAASEELNSKLLAYENELAELESALSELQDEGSYSNSSTSTDGTSFGANALNIDLTVELGIEQSTPVAEGIAILQRHIAETNREIEILNGQISLLNEENALTTPIDGIVEDIILEGNMITFVITSSTKKLVTYVNEQEWQKIELDQAASFTIFEGDDELEQEIDATVVQKQQIPATKSLGYDTLLTQTKLDKQQTVYEVSIEPTDFLETTPLGEIFDVTIVVNAGDGVYETFADWVVDYEVEDLGDKHIYSIGYDGKTRLTPITVLFEHETHVAREIKEEDLDTLEIPIDFVEEEAEEVTTAPPRIQNVELKKTKEDEKDVSDEEQPLNKAVVFSATLDEPAIIMNGDAKNIYAPTYMPFPFKTFDKEMIEPFTWKDALRYILPQ